MKLASKNLSLIVAAGVLVLAGCSKTPPRPSPDATALGQSLNPPPDTSAPSNFNTVAPGTELAARDPNSPIDDGNTIRNQFGAASQVFFDYDRSDVKQAERAKFPAVKDYLAKNPGTRVLFEGHCDWRGTAEYNLALGERRASAAKKYLQSLGVKADQIETTSKGSLEAAKNADAATMEKDRRVDIVIIKAKQPGATPAL